MYMRMTWFKLRPNCWEQYEAKYRELVIPDKGLCARWLSRDTNDTDAVYIISLWEDMASLQEWETSRHFQEIFMPKVQPLIIGELTVSVCKVESSEFLSTCATGQSPRK